MKNIDIDAVLKTLTLEEKASLCSGQTNWLTKSIDEKGVPSVWMSDGPHGLRKEKVLANGGTNIMQESEPATCFPPAVTTASSWDTELIEEVGEAIANEAKALKVVTVLGPGINIKRSPLCGRNFEYFSEDPFLAGRMGAAWVHGVQKNGVGVSLKHFCANNQEHIRMSVDTIVDERALREIYLSAFEHIVKTEQPQTIMCSYNRLNGTYLSDNKRLLTDILRDEWGFKGIVMSDWGAVNNRVEGIKAGLDLEMPGNGAMNDRNIVTAVRNGNLSVEELDKVVTRMLKYALESKESEVKDFKVDFKKHHEIARRAAAGGAVLLKNEGALPLEKGKRVTVIGTLAKKLRYQGSGSSFINTTEITSFLDAMDQAGQPYEYAAGYTLKGDGYSAKLIREAAELAKGKENVLVFIGLTDAYESEGFDRKHINLPDSHNILVEELLKVNKNITVVLSCGSPVKVRAWEKDVKGILNLYLGGQAGGGAAYDIIFGDVNPSGKLAETFPLRNHDNIVARYFPMGPRAVEYRESIYVGYRYFDAAGKNVQYPFGYGLSYTTFEYSDIELSADSIREGEELTVSFKIKNTGGRDGAEVAQVYVADKESTIFRPVKELKGFTKVFLKAGEEKKVSVVLDARAFQYYNTAINDWHTESGAFGILVGASSRDIRLSAEVSVESANPDAPIPALRDKAPYYYDIAGAVKVELKEIPADQFAALYGRELPDNRPFELGELTENSTVSQIAISPWGKFICSTLTQGANLAARGSENGEMIRGTVRDIPMRAFSGFTGGLISQASLAGLVDMVNRKKGGFRRFMKGFKKTAEEKAANKAYNEKSKREKLARLEK